MKLVLLTLSLLSSIVSAHFSLDFPPAREADEEQQGTFPCSGSTAPGSRTAWPLDGGSIQMTLGHSRSAVQVLLALGNDPGSNFNVVLVPTIQEEGLGEFCFSGVRVPEDLGVRDGDNATIQVVTDSHVTGGLYNCTFGQGITTTQYTGPANANGTDSSSPATESAATPSPTGSPAAEDAPSGAAGKRGFGGVVVLCILAAGFLW
ncbi:MAG: hypothetical protein Q9171_005055 [Xanthocarpia ochracea]